MFGVGTLACWNHPFEVARIEMQAAASAGEKSRSMMEVFRMIVKTDGVKGLFQGLIPRVGLGIWQTLFMVTGEQAGGLCLGMIRRRWSPNRVLLLIVQVQSS